MKKFYSMVAIALLSATTIMAQTSLPSIKNIRQNPTAVKKNQHIVSAPKVKVDATVLQGIVTKAGMTKSTMSKAPAKVSTRAALAANQKYAGPYVSDSYETNPDNGGGYPYVSTDLGVFSFFDTSEMEKFNGGKVVGMRFALANPADVKKVEVLKVDKDGYLSDWLSYSYRMGQTSKNAGWTEVTFKAPGEFNTDDFAGLLVGFTYTQKSDKTSNASFPLSFVNEGDYLGEVYLEGPFGQGGALGLAYWGIEQQYGNLSVQLIIEKEYPVKDVVIKGFATDKDWTKGGDNLKYSFAVNNFGIATINELELGLYIDQKLVGQTTVKDLTSATQTGEGTIALSKDLALGKHTLTIWAVNADGKELTENTYDDMTGMYFYVYDQTVARQKTLMEQFTSQYCMWCQVGATNLSNFANTRNDLAWVAVHGNMGEDARDIFFNEACDYSMALQQVNSFPSASFNRTFLSSSIATGIGWNSATTEEINAALGSYVDYVNSAAPALATVDISGSYDKDTRLLTVKVYGKGVNVDELLTNYGVTVYLTENGLVAPQLNSDGKTWNQNYVHDHVLRAVMTSPVGTKINWNGDKYEMTFTTTLESGWNADNMNVVAFVNPLVDTQNFTYEAYMSQWVTNANSISVKEIAAGGTGINGVYNNGADAVETARYNAAGQMISAPRKGLNIVKMSNGETRKVIVK